jgi:hypothetical protein
MKTNTIKMALLAIVIASGTTACEKPPVTPTPVVLEAKTFTNLSNRRIY